MDIIIAILVVVFAYVLFKSLWAVLIAILLVALAVYLIRRAKASSRL